MDSLFWIIVPILIVVGINEISKWGAQDAALKSSQEREKQRIADKKAFEEKWKTKAATFGKTRLITELQENIRFAKADINSLYWDEGGIIYDPDDPYNDDELNERYKNKHRAYDKKIAEFEKAIKYLNTLP